MIEANASWISPEARCWAKIIQSSHRKAFSRSLLKEQSSDIRATVSECQELFSYSNNVLAHDNKSDPLLVYANAAAIRLWCNSWAEMVNMPSRLSTPEQARKERINALSNAQKCNAYQGYHGIRCDRRGRRFAINNARIWTLWDEQGYQCGQAASFSNWWWIAAATRPEKQSTTF